MQRFVPIEDVFKGRHFDRQIIVLCVSWYTSFKLSLRDLVIMMADRGISVTHTTILRWVQRYLPEFEKRWRRYARPVGGSWRMDETYIKVHGQWVYLGAAPIGSMTCVRVPARSCVYRLISAAWLPAPGSFWLSNITNGHLTDSTRRPFPHTPQSSVQFGCIQTSL